MIPFLDVSQVLLTSSGQLQQLWLWDDANWFLNNISSPAITNIITDIITIKYVRPCDVKVGGGLWEHDITNFVLIALTRKQFVIYWTSLVPDVDCLCAWLVLTWWVLRYFGSHCKSVINLQPNGKMQKTLERASYACTWFGTKFQFVRNCSDWRDVVIGYMNIHSMIDISSLFQFTMLSMRLECNV